MCYNHLLFVKRLIADANISTPRDNSPMQWSSLLNNPIVIFAVVTSILIVLLLILIAVVVQGREISFWPPKISARSAPDSPFTYRQADVNALLGEWFEEISGSPERRYSIGVFRIDKVFGTCTYDGTNYKTTADEYCTWRSKVVIVDAQARQVYYIFTASIQGEMHSTNTGFGALNLVVGANGEITMTSGHYIEARQEGRPLSHTMVPLDAVAKELGIARSGTEGSDFYKRVIRAYEARRIGNKR